MEPTRRTASSSADLASAESIRRAWRRSSAATVWRLFFTRWWISRMVASLVTSSRSRRRRSLTSRTSTSAPIRVPCGRSGIDRTISATEDVAELGVAVRPATEHRAQRLLVRALSRRDQVARQVGQHHPGRGRRTGPADGRPTARWDSRRRPPGLVHPQEAVADAGRVGVVAALARATGSARRRSSGSGRPRSAGRTARAGWASGRPAGWCADRPPRSPGRPGGPGWSRCGPGRRRATPGRPRGPAGPRRTPGRPAGVGPSARSCRRCRRHRPSGRSWAASGRPPRSRCRRGRATTAPGRRS